MSSVWCSPLYWHKQSLDAWPSLTQQCCLDSQSEIHPKVSCVRERVAEERQKAPTLTPPLEYTNTSASQHPCVHVPLPTSHPPLPLLSSLHPSTVHSRTEVGLTFCPGSQALRHRWVPADIRRQRRKAQAGWQRRARRASRGGMRVQPLRQWEETAAGWAPLHNLLS